MRLRRYSPTISSGPSGTIYRPPSSAGGKSPDGTPVLTNDTTFAGAVDSPASCLREQTNSLYFPRGSRVCLLDEALNGARFELENGWLQLNEDVVAINEGSEELLIPAIDLVGAKVQPGGVMDVAWAPERTDLVSKRHRNDTIKRVLQTKTIKLKAAEAAPGLQSMLRRLATCCKEPRNRRVFVIINPHGGKRWSRQLYAKVIEPMLQYAGIDPDVVVTDHAGHAKELGEKYDPLQYEGVITVSGDGIVNEFTNGLLTRRNWHELIRRTAICTVKAGTTNAIAAGVRTNDPTYAIWCVIKRKLRPLDAMLVVNGHDMRALAVCVFGWGMATGVAADSEPYRYLGIYRYSYLKLRHAVLIGKGYERFSATVDISTDVGMTDPELADYYTVPMPIGSAAENEGAAVTTQQGGDLVAEDVEHTRAQLPSFLQDSERSMAALPTKTRTDPQAVGVGLDLTESSEAAAVPPRLAWAAADTASVQTSAGAAAQQPLSSAGSQPMQLSDVSSARPRNVNPPRAAQAVEDGPSPVIEKKLRRSFSSIRQFSDPVLHPPRGDCADCFGTVLGMTCQQSSNGLVNLRKATAQLLMEYQEQEIHLEEGPATYFLRPIAQPQPVLPCLRNELPFFTGPRQHVAHDQPIGAQLDREILLPDAAAVPREAQSPPRTTAAEVPTQYAGNMRRHGGFGSLTLCRPGCRTCKANGRLRYIGNAKVVMHEHADVIPPPEPKAASSESDSDAAVEPNASAAAGALLPPDTGGTGSPARDGCGVRSGVAAATPGTPAPVAVASSTSIRSAEGVVDQQDSSLAGTLEHEAARKRFLARLFKRTRRGRAASKLDSTIKEPPLQSGSYVHAPRPGLVTKADFPGCSKTRTVSTGVTRRGFFKRREEGEFTTVVAINLAAEALYHHASDGFMDLLIVRGGSLTSSLRLAARYVGQIVGLTDVYGPPLHPKIKPRTIHSPLVDYFKARCMIITPAPEVINEAANVDGELFPGPGPFKVYTLPSLLTMYGEY